MARETVAGTADITFVPLRASLTEVTLDAAPGLDVASVTLDGSAPLALDRQRSAVRVTLPAALGSPAARTLRVTYATRPRTGLYFFPGGPGRAPQAWNYGEGGIHYGWLPLYNGTDDRFTLDLRITAPRPLVVVANGTLRETVENADGTRTFHWTQDEPIPNYLIALQVGDFARVPLDDARLATRTVPLAVWTIPGTEKNAAFAFGATPRMVEFFSRRFGYEYPWAAYDQVTLRDFSGAMETTGAVGFSESFLRGAGDPHGLGAVVRRGLPGVDGRGHHRPRAGPSLVRRPRHLPLAGVPVAERVVRVLLPTCCGTARRTARTTSPISAGATSTATSTTSAPRAPSGPWSSTATRRRGRCTRRRRPT